jgi:hypothetical protein
LGHAMGSLWADLSLCPLPVITQLVISGFLYSSRVFAPKCASCARPILPAQVGTHPEAILCQVLLVCLRSWARVGGVSRWLCCTSFGAEGLCVVPRHTGSVSPGMRSRDMVTSPARLSHCCIQLHSPLMKGRSRPVQLCSGDWVDCGAGGADEEGWELRSGSLSALGLSQSRGCPRPLLGKQYWQ